MEEGVVAMSTMTGPVVSTGVRIVPCIMKELREMSGGKEAVEGVQIASAIHTVLVMDEGYTPGDYPPGINAIVAGCECRPKLVQELKYVERELYGAFTRPTTS